MMKALLLFGALGSDSTPDTKPPAAADPCAGALPDAVRSVLPNDMHVATPAELIMSHHTCEQIAKADVNGDKLPDFVILLVGDKFVRKVAVALAHQSGYDLVLLTSPDALDEDLAIQVNARGVRYKMENGCLFDRKTAPPIMSAKEVGEFDSFCVGRNESLCYVFRKNRWHAVQTAEWEGCNGNH